jgi:hypothetical protein
LIFCAQRILNCWAEYKEIQQLWSFENS